MRRFFVATVLLAILCVSPSVFACTVFVLVRGGQSVYGQKLDWHKPMPGFVLVNKRDVKKSVLPWKGFWPADGAWKDVEWVSRYGSVTFTCYGRDFIEGGMNEEGLVVDETSLTARYPVADERPGISCAQWMQYQLDNFATVEEVFSHLNDLRPDGEGWHYLIADRHGDCAVIEYLDGTPRVYRRESLGFPILTNTTYAQALTHIPMDISFGGSVDIAAGKDSYGRFVRVAGLLRDYDSQVHGSGAVYAFHILDAVRVDDTRRSVVYDAEELHVVWKSKNHTPLRWLELDDLDFSGDTPVQMIDIDAKVNGDVAHNLIPYNCLANEEMTRQIFQSADSASLEELNARGFTLDEAVETVAYHPTRVAHKCTKGCRIR